MIGFREGTAEIVGSVSTGGGSRRGDEEGKISGERGVGKQKKS